MPVKDSDRIDIVMEKTGLNANRLAKELGIPRAQGIYDIQSGKIGISSKIAEKIVKRFPEFSVNWLITGDGNPIETDHNELAEDRAPYNVHKKQPPANEGVAVDIGATLVKIEATTDVMFSVLAEILASQKGQLSTIVQKELEREVGLRIDFLEQRRLKA